MDFEPRSAHHLTRNALPYGSIPPLRPKFTPSAGPTNRQITRKVSRRKRSTEQIFLTDQVTASHQENKGILQQRSNSAAPSESIRVQSTKHNKPTHAPIPLITSGAGAAKKISKVKLFHTSPTIASTLGKSVKGQRNSAAKKAARKGYHPTLPKPPPPILDVTHTDVVPDTATYTTPYLSIYTLDDLSRWDMDSIPSILSPPTSPGNNSPFGPTLFSTLTDDDDELVENEIPFPLIRQHNVLENMGVKKSKNKARGNIEGTLSRHIIPPRAKSPPSPRNATQERSTLPGLPYPLPLRTLSDNAEKPHSLSTLTRPQVMSSPQPTSGPSTSKKDTWGCMHLGAADCDLSIVFPLMAHYEIWDMADEYVFIV